MTAAGARTELPAEPAKHGSEWAWKLRVLAIVVVFAVITLVRSHAVDIPLKDPHGKLFRAKLIDTGEMLVLFLVIDLCYRNLKSWDVLLSPHDEMLLRWDRWLFFGHSPAVLLHDLLGQDLAARLLTDLYESFSTLVTIALVAALAFTPTVRSAYVFVVSAMWAWIIGVGSYYLIPTLGPFHAAPEEFSGLTR